MKNKPNILIISTHDTGRHFGCYGVPTVQTPSIDRLASEGIKFNRMFAACPICSPSRGALLTGQYPLTNGLVGLCGGSWNWELSDYRVHLSHRLRDRGYHTAMFGLQHETTHPERLGFDDLSCHGVRRDNRGHPATDVAGDVCRFLADHDGKQPFYAQVGFFETHTPYPFGECVPDSEKGTWVPPYARAHDWAPWSSILSRFGGDGKHASRHIAELQGAVRQADRGVGMILDALEANGLAQNTLLLFTTDHGPELPGAKWTMYDPGLGIAFILRWPGGGISGGEECDQLLGNVDFLPTLFELAGLEMPDDLEGHSFAAACRNPGDPAAATREVVFSNWVDGLNFSARTDRYKLIRNLVAVDSTGRHSPPYELYDLEKDPLELTNVAEEPAYSAAFNELRHALEQWLSDMNDPTAHAALPADEHTAMIAEYRKRYEALRRS